MSIRVNKESVFSEETIEKAGLSEEFKKYAENTRDKYNHAARKLSTRTELAVGVGMGGLAMASASLQDLLLPSNPAIVATGIAMGVAGAIGCAMTEVAKNNKKKLAEELSTPFNFFKEKMNMKDNNDGTIDLSLKSEDMQKTINQEQNPDVVRKLENEEKIKALGLSKEFEEFAKKNSETYHKARMESGSALQEGLGFLGMGGLAAFSAQVQESFSSAMTVAETSLSNILSNGDPMMITAAVVGVAGAAGFGAMEYTSQKKIKGLKEDINNSDKFLEEFEDIAKTRNMLNDITGYNLSIKEAKRQIDELTPEKREKIEELANKNLSQEERTELREKYQSKRKETMQFEASKDISYEQELKNQIEESAAYDDSVDIDVKEEKSRKNKLK